MDLRNTLRCPTCLNDLVNHESHFTCYSCRKTFPVCFGIPDFRLFPPSEEELRRCAYLFDLHEKLSFEDLIIKYYSWKQKTADKKLVDIYLKYRLTSQDRAKEHLKFAGFEQNDCKENTKEIIGLDIGCGCGCGIAALLEIGNSAIGIDVYMPDLIIARSFLKQMYPGRNYLIVAGIAEHLPFDNEKFSHVTAIDVIEHVAEPKVFISEAYRVMRPSGYFYFDTMSRFHWTEPHTQLPAVGYLPRFLQPLYVRLALHRNYEIHLPSLWELKKWLNKSQFEDNWKIVHDQIESTSKPRTWRGKMARSIPILLSLVNTAVRHTSIFRITARKTSD